MPGSDNSSERSNSRTLVPRLSRYDLLLWTIPLAFLLALVVSTVLSASTEASLLAASLVGALVVFDGLFRNPPTVGSAG